MLCKHLKSITTRVSVIHTWWENHQRITVEKRGSIPCLQRRRCFKLNTDSDRYQRTYAWTALVLDSLHFITVIDTKRYEQNSSLLWIWFCLAESYIDDKIHQVRVWHKPSQSRHRSHKQQNNVGFQLTDYRWCVLHTTHFHTDTLSDFISDWDLLHVWLSGVSMSQGYMARKVPKQSSNNRFEWCSPSIKHTKNNSHRSMHERKGFLHNVHRYSFISLPIYRVQSIQV